MKTATRRLVKTEIDGTKVFSEIRRVNGMITGVWVWVNKKGETVNEREPTFDELAGHSPASRRFGR